MAATRTTGTWGYPLLEGWGVRPHQQFTPAARRRLVFTVTSCATYADAAELATEWDHHWEERWQA